MTNFIIKSHKVGTIYTKPHLFILNKGLNSGKPQSHPFTNSFVIVFQNSEDFEKIYFIALALWKTNFWKPFLCGSVIPFLKIDEFKKEFFNRYKNELYEHDEHLKNIQTLKALEQSEKKHQENLVLINELRHVILNRYCKK